MAGGGVHPVSLVLEVKILNPLTVPLKNRKNSNNCPIARRVCSACCTRPINRSSATENRIPSNNRSTDTIVTDVNVL